MMLLLHCCIFECLYDCSRCAFCYSDSLDWPYDTETLHCLKVNGLEIYDAYSLPVLVDREQNTRGQIFSQNSPLKIPAEGEKITKILQNYPH